MIEVQTTNESDVDRHDIKHVHQLTRNLIEAEKSHKAAKAQAQALGVPRKQYDPNSHYEGDDDGC